MSKTEQEWKKLWEGKIQFTTHFDNQKDQKTFNDSLRLLRLLAFYSGHKPQEKQTTGSMARLFSGRWSTTYGKEVLGIFKDYDTFGQLENPDDADKYTVEKILEQVSHRLGNNKIKPDGDLHKIIKVCYEKTKNEQVQELMNSLVQPVAVKKP